jgi:hypothetical protein
VLSPCVTYNDTYTLWDTQYIDLDTDDEYDPTNRSEAFSRVAALHAEGRIPIGLIYSNPKEAPATLTHPAASDTNPHSHLASYKDILNRYKIEASQRNT